MLVMVDRKDIHSMRKNFCANTNCINFRAKPVSIIGGKSFPGNCNILGLEIDENGQCLYMDPVVISIDGGHGSLNKNRKCPQCSEPTILFDSGWECCSSCDWKER